MNIYRNSQVSAQDNTHEVITWNLIASLVQKGTKRARYTCNAFKFYQNSEILCLRSKCDLRPRLCNSRALCNIMLWLPLQERDTIM